MFDKMLALATDALTGKAVWTTAYVNDLPDSSFLFVEPGDKDDEGKTVPRSKRHFPYKDASGKVDLPHLRNAIARIPQSNAPGLDKQALQKRAQAMLQNTQGGKSAEVGYGVKVIKQADGRYRWVGWPTNHFRDNDTPPEILSAKAHKEFIAWAYKQKKFPELWLWHVPGSKVGQADFMDFDDGIVVASGLFDEAQDGAAKALEKTKEPLTMSHGFLRLKYDTQNVVTDGYRMAEMSVTPKGVEANVFTNFLTVKEESMPLSKDKRDFLAKFLSEEQIKGIEDGTDDLRKAAEAAGVDFKELEPVTDVTEPEPRKEEPIAEAPTIEVDAVVDRVVEAIADRFQFKALSDSLQSLSDQTKFIPDLAKRIGVLEATMAQVKKTDDAKVAETMRPKAAEGLFWMANRPSQSLDTALQEGNEEDDKLKANKPTAAQSLIELAFGN